MIVAIDVCVSIAPFVKHPHAETGVPWCQPQIISETTSDSRHQRLKVIRRAVPRATTLHRTFRYTPPIAERELNTRGRYL